MAHPTSSTETAPILCKSESLPTPKPALVNISQVNGHLVLLHAFAELKNQVEKLHQSVSHMPAQPDKRWAWFVAMSVERFDIWCHKLEPSDAEKSLEVILPPLDVMMVWHTYMLNPMWYAEDSMTLPACQVLRAVGVDFAAALDGRLQSILIAPPSQARKDFWVDKTALPFDYIQSSHKLHHVGWDHLKKKLGGVAHELMEDSIYLLKKVAEVVVEQATEEAIDGSDDEQSN